VRDENKKGEEQSSGIDFTLNLPQTEITE
jgi:hypothetical protein